MKNKKQNTINIDRMTGRWGLTPGSDMSEKVKAELKKALNEMSNSPIIVCSNDGQKLAIAMQALKNISKASATSVMAAHAKAVACADQALLDIETLNK